MEKKGEMLFHCLIYSIIIPFIKYSLAKKLLKRLRKK